MFNDDGLGTLLLFIVLAGLADEDIFDGDGLGTLLLFIVLSGLLED